MNRRHALRLLSAVAAAVPLVAAKANTPPLRQLGPNTYVLPGRNAYARRSNGGRVVNTGIITGPHGALVIDPGPHLSAGMTLTAVVQKELRVPIVGVINTHAAPEYVLGNAAFSDLPIYANATTRQLMSSRCEACLQRLTLLLGQQAMDGTTITLPNRTLETGNALPVENIMVDVQVFHHADTPGSLALFVPESQTIFGGALAYRNRIPDMQDASIYGWLQAIDTMKRWPARWFVGAGLGTPSQTLHPTRQYLQMLERQIAMQIRRGGELADLRFPRRQRWQDWSDFHRQHPLNIQRAWRELEELWWKGALPD